MAPQKPRPRQDKNKRQNRQGKTSHDETESMSLIPVELQQLLLNIFKDAFATRLDSDIHPLLQEVKGHLYNRDFATAFGRNDYLEAYAARWSPSRALGYAQVLAQMKELADGAQSSILSGGKIVCLGGGAGAEIVALGGFLNLLQRSKSRDDSPPQLEVVAVDIADWSQVVTKLHQNITTAPTLSKYASAAVKEANAPLLGPGQINVTFQQHDVLNADIPVLSSLLHGAILVTIMFTLNELYSTSLPLTQRFLLNLTACLPAGALLLVVDSPGSYSSVSLNGAEKKYPMQWLLDHTLLKEDPKTDAVAWKKITEDESQWFRLESTLRYPIELEHMRFQLHLYKRTG